MSSTQKRSFEKFSHYLSIIKMNYFITYDLIGFMSFACNQHNISGLSL